MTFKKFVSLSCAQKKEREKFSRSCPSYLSRSNLTPGSSRGSLFSAVMDKAGPAAAAPVGVLVGDPEAPGSVGSSGCIPAERREGDGEAAVIREGTSSCLIVFFSRIVVNKIERATTDKRSKDT